MTTYAECAVRALNEQGFSAGLTESGKVVLSVWNNELNDKFEFILSDEEVLLHGKEYAKRFEREVTCEEWEAMDLLKNPIEEGTVAWETYGEQFERLLPYIASNQVVTLMDDNDGKGTYIYFGYRKVNALLYYVTERSLDFIGDDIFDGSIIDVTGMTTVYFGKE